MQRHEDSVKTSIDIEVKMNKLYQTNLAMRNRQATLLKKITEREFEVDALKENGRRQEAQILSLLSLKA